MWSAALERRQLRLGQCPAGPAKQGIDAAGLQPRDVLERRATATKSVLDPGGIGVESAERCLSIGGGQFRPEAGHPVGQRVVRHPPTSYRVRCSLSCCRRVRLDHRPRQRAV